MKKSLNEIRVEGNVAFIDLGQGRMAKITADDVHKIQNVKWRAWKSGGKLHPVTTFVRRDRPNKLIKLSKMISGLGAVNHLDGDQMNNTRENLIAMASLGEIKKHKKSIQILQDKIQEHKQAIQQLEQVTN
jgi:hypothetical protein